MVSPRKTWVSWEKSHTRMQNLLANVHVFHWISISHTHTQMAILCYFDLFYRFNLFSDSDIQRTRMGIWWVNRTRKW